VVVSHKIFLVRSLACCALGQLTPLLPLVTPMTHAWHKFYGGAYILLLCALLLQLTLRNVLFQPPTSSKYESDSDDDMLYRFTDRYDRGSEWTSMSASWSTKISADERQSTLPSSGLRALYEVLPSEGNCSINLLLYWS